MKKLSVFLSTILTIAIVAIAFTSCEDPAGVYKPAKKIAKVYEQEVGEPEYLSQEWTWDGNKVALSVIIMMVSLEVKMSLHMMETE